MAQISQLSLLQLSRLQACVESLTREQTLALEESVQKQQVQQALAASALPIFSIAESWLASMVEIPETDLIQIHKIKAINMQTVLGSTLALLPCSWLSELLPD